MPFTELLHDDALLHGELFVQFAYLGPGIRHPQIIIAAVRDGPRVGHGERNS